MLHQTHSDSIEWSWDNGADEAIYQMAVRGCLADSEITRHFGAREVTRATVLQAAYEPQFIAEAFEVSRTQYVDFRRAALKTEQLRELFAAARAHLVIDGLLVTCVVAALGVPLWIFVDVALTPGWLTNWGAPILLVVAIIVGLCIAVRPDSKRHAAHTVDTAILGWHLFRWQQRLNSRTSTWSSVLKSAGVFPQMRIVVNQMLGEDQDSLLIVEGHDGLKDVQNPRYIVSTVAERQLRQKMDQIDGGTIAICGPRGAGKSTLLRSCSTNQQSDRALDLSVFVHAPAEYTPQEFLMTLFGKVCERYLAAFTFDIAETGVFVAIRKRRIVRAIMRAIKWLVALAICLGLMAAGLARGAQWLYDRYATPVMLDRALKWWEESRDYVIGIWRNHPWISGFFLTLLGFRFMPRFRRRRTGPPSLAQECQRYLYRLRTVQNSATAVNLGLPPLQGISVGKSQTTSVSSVPLTFPELVSDFRELLAKIANQLQGVYSARVVIAIDELDRVGDPEQARKFLGQIKAIFGIKNVYYLVSVAEDVGAAFVRRGLPHRDVTDSSLDDLLYLQPRTIEESRKLLALRAPSVTSPFVQLVHALSGGIPRDLIRYARRLIEVHHWTDRIELKDLAPSMILEELADTLEGFRTLLAMKDWTAEGGPLLNRLYVLVRMLHSPADRGALETRIMIQFLADNPLPHLPNDTPSAGERPMSDDTLTLWQEASACAYFSLTLWDIFGQPDFDNRSARAREGGMNGEPQRLAEARQELAVSPYSARILLGDIRAAWGLPASESWADPE